MDLEPIRGVDLLTAHERHATVSWLWEGMLAAGNVTLLTSVWKAGKSSLLALLLAGRREGAVLLGRMIEAGASAVVSEEPAELWRRRARNLSFGPNLSLFCRPFTRTPSREQWHDLIGRLVLEHEQQGVNLVAWEMQMTGTSYRVLDDNDVSNDLRQLGRH